MIRKQKPKDFKLQCVMCGEKNGKIVTSYFQERENGQVKRLCSICITRMCAGMANHYLEIINQFQHLNRLKRDAKNHSNKNN